MSFLSINIYRIFIIWLVIMLSTLIAHPNEAQSVILFDDFESGLSAWSKSSTSATVDNEWYILNQNSALTDGASSAGVSSGDGTNTYINITSDHSIWIEPAWPSPASSYDITIQLDARANGEVLLGADYMSIYLVDVSDAVIPVKANLNAGNSILLGTLYSVPVWARYEISLGSSDLNFIQNAANDVKLVVNWSNDNNFVLNQPPATIDNVLIKQLASVKMPLAGSYDIGLGSDNNFATITDAFDYINDYGISNNVTLYLKDESYNNNFESFPLMLGDGTSSPFPGMGTYNLTIKPASGVTPTLEANSFLLNNTGVITLRGVSNVTIDGSNSVNGNSRDMTIISGDNLSDQAIPVFLGGISESQAMENITISNLNLEANNVITAYGIVASRYTILLDDGHIGAEAAFDNIAISNNNIYNVDEAIHIDGVDRTVLGYSGTSLASNITIEDNDINTADKIRQTGIHLLGANNSNITTKLIGDFLSGDLNIDVGIIIDKSSRDLVIAKNKIYNLGFDGDNITGLSAHGIEINAGLANANIEIKNNEIRGISGNGATSTINAGFANPVAILLGLGGEAGLLQLYSQSDIRVLNNSIYMFGDELDFATSVSMGISVASNTTDVEIVNNAIKNDLGGSTSLIPRPQAVGDASAVGTYLQSSSAQISDMDYNVYHVTANTAYTDNYVGLIGALSDIFTNGNRNMADWRTATGYENHSSFADPGYISTNDLEPDPFNSNSWNISGLGKHLTSVSDDIQTTGRPQQVADGAVDVGAYEFEADTTKSLPPLTTISGPFSTGVEYPIYVNQVELGTVTFNPGSDVPSNIDVRYFSGIWPEDPTAYNVANNFLDLSLDGVADPDYDLDLTLNYTDPYLGTLDMSSGDVSLTYDENQDGGWVALPTIVNTSDKTFTATGLRTLGRFSKTSGANVLPVTLYSFKGKHANGKNYIYWNTLSEINCDYFILEEKLNSDWRLLSRVDAQGGESKGFSYSVTDENSGCSAFYRLSYINFEGIKIVLGAINIQPQFCHEYFDVYPNPVQDRFVIKRANDDSLVEVSITNTKGLLVYAANSYEDLEIDVSSWSKGIYILTITSVSSNYTQLVIKR